MRLWPLRLSNQPNTSLLSGHYTLLNPLQLFVTGNPMVNMTAFELGLAWPHLRTYLGHNYSYNASYES